MAKMARIIAGLFVFAFILFSFSLDKKGLIDNEFQQRIKDSEAILKGLDLEQLQERFSLQIFPSGRHQSESQIDAMLRAHDHLDHPILYRSKLSADQVYTMSALGIER